MYMWSSSETRAVPDVPQSGHFNSIVHRSRAAISLTWHSQTGFARAGFQTDPLPSFGTSCSLSTRPDRSGSGTAAAFGRRPFVAMPIKDCQSTIVPQPCDQQWVIAAFPPPSVLSIDALIEAIEVCTSFWPHGLLK